MEYDCECVCVWVNGSMQNAQKTKMKCWLLRFENRLSQIHHKWVQIFLLFAREKCAQFVRDFFIIKFVFVWTKCHCDLYPKRINRKFKYQFKNGNKQNVNRYVKVFFLSKINVGV